MDFGNFFKIAMGRDLHPFPYQQRLATTPWPSLINVHTGMGKTAGVIISWLYKRHTRDKDTPRRLVYCLPMRVLVEQTYRDAVEWIDHLVRANVIEQPATSDVHLLMGGESQNDWDSLPESDAILVGTQDQLLSRAMNRGYAMSRFRWPIHFGLLNNDCLWVMDEVQLMGNGLATTCQLEAFRTSMGTVLPVHSLWMSATIEQGWLETVDFHSDPAGLPEISLSSRDMNWATVKRRFEAPKPLEKCPHSISTKASIPKFAKWVIARHQRGTRTLVVVNTVQRATMVYAAIKKQNPVMALTLLHSRFRPGDRQQALDALLAEPDERGTLCVSTQVIEAGVDVSAATLVTEAAPWASMIQRFGRCNRYGLEENPKVFWIDSGTKKADSSLPYEHGDIVRSFNILENLDQAGLKDLPSEPFDNRFNHLLRQKDLIDLFDTTPDLAGNDIDVSRFIRESDRLDVHVFWRNLSEKKPSPEEPLPYREELCPVSYSGVRAVEELTAWKWDHLEKEWIRATAQSIYPGLVLMMPGEVGCYSSELGWTGDKKDKPEILEPSKDVAEGNDNDFTSQTMWQTLCDHTDEVVDELKALLGSLGLNNSHYGKDLLTAARWHDCGKAHPAFQTALLGDPPGADTRLIWAKTVLKNIRYPRRGFRHELASALAMIENDLSDLVAYLAAAHHGKVRLSIRSFPYETRPDDPAKPHARGVWDGDELPETNLGGGVVLPKTRLSLAYMELGIGAKGAGWLSRMLALRGSPDFGPFRLGYLEALLRIADWRASSGKGDENA